MRVLSAALLIPVVLAIGCATKAPVASQPGPESVTASVPPEKAAPAAPTPAAPAPTDEKASPAKPAEPPAAKPTSPSAAKPAEDAPTAKPAEPSTAKPAAPSAAKPSTPSVATPPATATAKPPAPSTAKPAAPSTAKPAPPSEAAAKPAAPTPPAPKASAPAANPRVSALDLETLKEQLKGTKAIGVFTKLTLKNQVDDLLDRFRDHYAGKNKVTMTELRRSYDLLMMKVLSLIQDKDQKLATDIVASREAIWGLLADKEKFAALDV